MKEILKLLIETIGEGAMGGVVGAGSVYLLFIQQKVGDYIDKSIKNQTEHIDKRFDDLKERINNL